jgi:hypothetical protein
METAVSPASFLVGERNGEEDRNELLDNEFSKEVCRLLN